MNGKIIVAALGLAISGAAFSATPGAERAAPGLTRAEVLADLAIWTRAGLPQQVHSESGLDLFSPAYREAHARYLQLRNSAAYAEEVRRIGAAGGARATLASGG